MCTPVYRAPHKEPPAPASSGRRPLRYQPCRSRIPANDLEELDKHLTVATLKLYYYLVVLLPDFERP